MERKVGTHVCPGAVLKPAGWLTIGMMPQFANLFHVETKGAHNMSQLVRQAGTRTIQMMLRFAF